MALLEDRLNSNCVERKSTPYAARLMSCDRQVALTAPFVSIIGSDDLVS